MRVLVLEDDRGECGTPALVRPDGYLAWAGSARARGGAAWRQTLDRWTAPAPQ